MMGKSEEKQQPSPLVQGKYELGRVLGHGTFGKVYLARNVETGKSVAMKVVGKDKVIRVGMVEQLKREISVMRKVKHPNIVELHEVLASKTKIYLAMELVRGGELFSQVAKGRLPEDLARSYFSQIVSAVDFCHSRGVYHRDLKLENLLLDDQDSSSSSSDGGGGGDSFPVLKVTDFGLSAFAAGGDQLQTTCGTPAYVAPEVITRKGYDGAKADIWSCGVILYALLAGFLPFQDDNLMAMYRKIYKADFKCPPWMSRDARKLITRLLDPNPRTRATIPEIMESPWLNPKPNPLVVVVDRPPLPLHKSSAESEGKSVVEKGDGDGDEDEEDEESQQPEVLNAFHIISLSQGFNLSPLFEEKKRTKFNNLIFEADKKDDDSGGCNNNDDDNNDELRFATAGPASTVISKLEQVAANTEGRFQLLAVAKKKSASVADLQSYGGVRGGKGSSVDQQVRRISSGDGLAEGCCASRGGVMRVLQGKQSGRKGKLSIAAEIFSIAPSVVVVEVRKHQGDTLEYNRFCNQELRPALKDILWKSSSPAAG